ncbi:MAG TPA: GNAT family N-acetyltransferase [Haliangiales bacterium]|nr:GNAT family N-acetyltransferase [Haliangiales bacterium]
MVRIEETQGDLLISTDPSRLELDRVHEYLSKRSYWARGIPKEVLVRAVENSICAGVYRGTRQAAFARVVSDVATFAYLCDVFVFEEFRGRAIGKRIVSWLQNLPVFDGVRRWSLFTLDAHGLYEQSGWRRLGHPERAMEILRPYEVTP